MPVYPGIPAPPSRSTPQNFQHPGYPQRHPSHDGMLLMPPYAGTIDAARAIHPGIRQHYHTTDQGEILGSLIPLSTTVLLEPALRLVTLPNIWLDARL
jgi:hypothetical protein